MIRRGSVNENTAILNRLELRYPSINKLVGKIASWKLVGDIMSAQDLWMWADLIKVILVDDAWRHMIAFWKGTAGNWT